MAGPNSELDEPQSRKDGRGLAAPYTILHLAHARHVFGLGRELLPHPPAGSLRCRMGHGGEAEQREKHQPVPELAPGVPGVALGLLLFFVGIFGSILSGRTSEL